MNNGLRTLLLSFDAPRPIYFFVPVEGGFQAPVMMICKKFKILLYTNYAKR